MTFWDHDRAVDGECIFLMESDDLLNKVEVMKVYDSGAYRSTLLSFQDGMTMGGSNTKYEG